MKQNVLQNCRKFVKVGIIELELEISLGHTLYSTLMRFEDLITKKSVAKHFARLRNLKYAEPEQLRSYQLNALQKLLRHVYTNVPFYTERFDAQDIHPEDIQSLEDFAKIQPLTREDVKSNCDALISKLHDKADLGLGETSGSSGTPMIYYYDKPTYSAGRAAVLMGWELAGKKLGDKLITIWGSRGTVEEKWTKLGSRLKAKIYRNKRIGAYALSDESKIRDALDLMRGRKGGYVHGYTNAIYTLAIYAKDHEVNFKHKFDGILTTAENLFPFHRSIIEEVFGPVYDGYGCLEILGIAFQCQKQKGYHIIEPNLIFESENCVEDSREMIITDLWNYAFPLIRYKTGDLVSGEMRRDCPCGCNWSTFEKIVGRATDIISTSDGTLIYYVIWLVATTILDNHPYIKQFQWAKVAHNKLILRLLVHKEQDKFIENSIRSQVTPYLKGAMEFDVEFVDKFKINSSGKHKPVVDETK